MHSVCIRHIEVDVLENDLIYLQVMRIIAIFCYCCRCDSRGITIMTIFIGPDFEFTNFNIASTWYVKYYSLSIFLMNLQIATCSNLVSDIAAVNVNCGIIRIIPCIYNHFAIRHFCWFNCCLLCHYSRCLTDGLNHTIDIIINFIFRCGSYSYSMPIITCI